MKKCFKCGLAKELSEFYKHPKMGDGHLNKCKKCARQDVIKNRMDKVEYYRAYDRYRYETQPQRKELLEKIRKTEAHKISHKKASKKYYSVHLKKRKAHIKFGNALRDGKIKKHPCEICGSTENIQGHHDDYSKPLEVRWLCVKCHNKLHKRKRAIERYTAIGQNQVA